MKIAICAIIKDEQRYLEEWLQYHFKLGFDEIYLYEDLESTSHKEICDKYENVFLDKIENHFQTDRINIRRQRELYELFIEKYKDSFDWVAFIDIDEFIMTENNLDLKTILKEYNDVKGLYLFWKMYNANDLIEPNETYSVLENYTNWFKTTDIDLNMVKSMYNFNQMPELETHHRVKDGIKTDRTTNLEEPTYDKIWINHYYTKSWAEWCVKIYCRGDVWFGHRHIFDFFRINPEMRERLPELLSKMGSLVRKYK